MKIVPTHKLDFEACDNLIVASDRDVEENIDELLEWVQDINWPVAPLICERLKVIGLPLVAPVKSILLGTDAIWKYWVIYSLLNKVSNETLCLLKNELENIAHNPL